mgnify:CR=1 FL=1
MEKIIAIDNQNLNYPIVLVPDKIRNQINLAIDDTTIEAEIGIKKPIRKQLFKPQLPLKFTYQNEEKVKTIVSDDITLLFFVFIFSIIISFFQSSFREGLMAIFILNFGMFVLLFILKLLQGELLIKFKIVQNSKRVELNRDELKINEEEYIQRLEKYKIDCNLNETKFQAEYNLYESTILENRQIVKKKLFFQSLNPWANSIRTPTPSKRGVAELYFLERLDSELRALILMDMVPRLNWSDKKSTYCPDFTLICKETNLHIDIEIDEPYTLTEKQPIHFIGGGDESRNEFFLENNWCVIRFSEKQIVTQTAQCIETIKSIHKNIIDMKLAYSTNLELEPRWTYEESLVMQQKKFREKYWVGVRLREKYSWLLND